MEQPSFLEWGRGIIVGTGVGVSAKLRDKGTKPKKSSNTVTTGFKTCITFEKRGLRVPGNCPKTKEFRT
jgi:hypothetical protein